MIYCLTLFIECIRIVLFALEYKDCLVSSSICTSIYKHQINWFGGEYQIFSVSYLSLSCVNKIDYDIFFLLVKFNNILLLIN